MPSRHEGAHQALGELRRIVDAARHRIRGEFIPRKKKIAHLNVCRTHANGFNDVCRKDLVTKALASVISDRSRFAGQRLALRRLLLTFAVAVVVENIRRISRKNKKGYDCDDDAGPEKGQGAKRLRCSPRCVKAAIHLAFAVGSCQRRESRIRESGNQGLSCHERTFMHHQLC